MLKDLGVELDAAAAESVGKEMEPSSKPAVELPANLATSSPAIIGGWTAIEPTSVAKLRQARERIMRLAASGRVDDAGDLRELREVASGIREVLSGVSRA